MNRQVLPMTNMFLFLQMYVDSNIQNTSSVGHECARVYAKYYDIWLI